MTLYSSYNDGVYKVAMSNMLWGWASRASILGLLAPMAWYIESTLAQVCALVISTDAASAKTDALKAIFSTEEFNESGLFAVARSFGWNGKAFNSETAPIEDISKAFELLLISCCRVG